MEIKAVLFDMDGVLIESEYLMRHAAIQALADYGITAHKSVGLPALECLMVRELVLGGLDGIHGEVCYADYECLR